jgi:hypothetical protein
VEEGLETAAYEEDLESSLVCFPIRPHGEEPEPESEQMNAIGENEMWLKWTYDVDNDC